MPLPGAFMHRAGKSRLNPLVLLSARSDWRSGILFAPQLGPNASIEGTRPVGRNPHHSPESSDW
ncbi:hypothetical protein ES708_05239 [subsurface metagenome]